MGSNPTIKDVAKKAGVSITTVSFVLNNRLDVAISAEVKKRVLAVAQEMDYHPSAMAAGLAGRRTRNLGVVFYLEDKVISNQFYSFVIEGIVKETLGKNFNLLFSYVDSAYEDTRSLPKIVREKNVDGVLLVGRSEPKMVADIRERRIPVVAVDNFPDLEGVDTIQTDNHRGASLAVDHLIQLGHKHIGLLTTAGERPSLEERKAGWRDAHAIHNLAANKDYVFESGAFTFYEGYAKAKEVLKKHKKLTALFCANDEMAAGALRAAREVGRSVPLDLSVVGFDNITMSNYTDPPLTSISTAKEFMGKMAVDRIFELIEKKELPPLRMEAPVELVVRQSTSKPLKAVRS